MSEVKPVSMVAPARGKPYNSNPHGLYFFETTAFVDMLLKGIYNGEC